MNEKLNILVTQWRARPAESRKAIVAELREMVDGWSQTATSQETIEDVESLKIVVNILELADGKE